MVILILIFLIACVLGGILYRLGGIGDNPAYNWIPKWLRHPKARDVGVPLVGICQLLLWLYPIYTWKVGLALLISFGCWLGSLTTYHKWLNKFFGKPTTDCYWFNWLAHGLVSGLALLPLAIVTGWWLGLGLRTIALGVGCMFWSEKISNDNLEEGGRGFLNIFTLPLQIIQYIFK